MGLFHIDEGRLNKILQEGIHLGSHANVSPIAIVTDNEYHALRDGRCETCNLVLDSPRVNSPVELEDWKIRNPNVNPNTIRN